MEQIKKVLDDVLGRSDEEILNTRLDSLPLDSMGVVELVEDLEFALGIEFDSTRNVDATQTVSQFIESLPVKS